MISRILGLWAYNFFAWAQPMEVRGTSSLIGYSRSLIFISTILIFLMKQMTSWIPVRHSSIYKRSLMKRCGEDQCYLSICEGKAMGEQPEKELFSRATHLFQWKETKLLFLYLFLYNYLWAFELDLTLFVPMRKQLMFEYIFHGL